MANPYDELPYRSRPIEWSAPERLAIASLVHGGPRPPLDAYRVLELGCGPGANLLPLAYYRRHATFVGIDGAASQVDLAKARASALDLPNVEFIHADFLSADERLSGAFDYILLHGVFSWVSGPVRDALLRLVARRLRPGGLVYLNYNSKPGWNVRGLVREVLLARTADGSGLLARAQSAREVAASLASALAGVQHPYTQLLARELKFVCDGDITWVAHEFLAPDNHPYWRSEFLALARSHGLEYVADADFNHVSGRVSDNVPPEVDVEKIAGSSVEDTVDFLCYRQLHSPILALSPFTRTPPSLEEWGNLIVASGLSPAPPSADSGNPVFKHPSGLEVEAKEEELRVALEKLLPLWPRGLRVKEVFQDVGHATDDLVLLYRQGLIDLRCIEPADFGIPADRLNIQERDWGGYATTRWHQYSQGA